MTRSPSLEEEAGPLQAVQTLSGNKNEKLQPVLLGNSLGLAQYKEKAQKLFTRDPCPAELADPKDYLSIF